MGEQTYRNVKSLIEPVNQSIIVSGESGAGKVGEPLSYPVNFLTGGVGREEGGHSLWSRLLPSHSQIGWLKQGLSVQW